MQAINLLSNQLNELKLYGIKHNIDSRLKHAQQEETDFISFLSILFQDEINYKKTSRIKRLIKRAAFKQQASLEAFDLAIERGITKKQINEFSTCQFLRNGQNMVISGPTGVGKSYLSQAIGNHACRQGLSVMFFRMNALIEQTALARLKAQYLNFIRKLTSVDILVLDDFGIKPLQPQQFQDFYDVIDERGEAKSLVMTTQVPVENWGEVIADPVTCEAITDRIVAGSVTLKMKGESYRPKNKKV
jgi:DNA replication protein DnaC